MIKNSAVMCNNTRLLTDIGSGSAFILAKPIIREYLTITNSDNIGINTKKGDSPIVFNLLIHNDIVGMNDAAQNTNSVVNVITKNLLKIPNEFRSVLLIIWNRKNINPIKAIDTVIKKANHLIISIRLVLLLKSKLLLMD